MIDYIDNARERVKLAITDHDTTRALVIAQIATAEATIALVEQQRIANLITIGETHEFYTVPADTETGEEEYRSTRMRADIREALRL